MVGSAAPRDGRIRRFAGYGEGRGYDRGTAGYKREIGIVDSWKFAEHDPTTLIVTYEFVSEGKCKREPVTKDSAKMDLPMEVTVSTKFSFPCPFP